MLKLEVKYTSHFKRFLQDSKDQGRWGAHRSIERALFPLAYIAKYLAEKMYDRIGRKGKTAKGGTFTKYPGPKRRAKGPTNPRNFKHWLFWSPGGYPQPAGWIAQPKGKALKGYKSRVGYQVMLKRARKKKFNVTKGMWKGLVLKKMDPRRVVILFKGKSKGQNTFRKGKQLKVRTGTRNKYFGQVFGRGEATIKLKWKSTPIGMSKPTNNAEKAIVSSYKEKAPLLMPSAQEMRDINNFLAQNVKPALLDKMLYHFEGFKANKKAYNGAKLYQKLVKNAVSIQSMQVALGVPFKIKIT